MSILNLDRSIAERIEVVINAAACLEAFINAVGQETVPHWKLYDKLNVEGKWQLCLTNAGSPELYDPGREPFQTLGKIIHFRNTWLHYGRPFDRVVTVQRNEVVTKTDATMDLPFVASLPDRLRELITQMCFVAHHPFPMWLYPSPGWDV